MVSTIDSNDLFSWCQIPVDNLEGHPRAKVPIKVLPSPDDVHKATARMMADELIENNAKGQSTRWILPCGPTRQYPYFSKIVNDEGISLRNLHAFHMDDCLDWQGRPVPLDSRFSYQGTMIKIFYDPIKPELSVPLSQRHFPDVYHIDAISEEIEKVGGIDTVFGGIGYRGHIAYNEPPRSPWYTISNEEYRNSKTRILNLNDDTLIAVSQRTVGGCSQAVPPMAITLGMKDILSAKKIRLLSDTGTWKQTVIRVLLFGPQTVEYPVTFVQDHPDVLVIVDRLTASAPLG